MAQEEAQKLLTSPGPGRQALRNIAEEIARSLSCNLNNTAILLTELAKMEARLFPGQKECESEDPWLSIPDEERRRWCRDAAVKALSDTFPKAPIKEILTGSP